MLALLKDEAGSEMVRHLLEDEQVTSYAHAVNLCEVFYDFGSPSLPQNQARAQTALDALFEAAVIECNDMDGQFWRDVAFLIAERRSHPPRAAKPREKARLALGDAFGLALARRLNCEFITADRGEIEPLQNAGLCRAVFLR